jgi:segregation and condensation protein A
VELTDRSAGDREAVPDDASFVVLTSVFDGPLDLLLHLVRRDGIDLERLEVARVADAYLAWLDRMRSLDLSVAGEWLVLAATLVHLKSLSLLPRMPVPKDGEAEIDPREAFARQLRDHAEARAGADALDLRPQVGRDVAIRRREGAIGGPAPVATEVDAFGLLDVLFEVLARGDRPEPRIELAVDHRPDAELCCRRVLSLAPSVGDRMELVPLLGSLPTRGERVVTFVGVLEMTRLGWIGVRQETHLGPIEVERLADDDAIDLSRVLGHGAQPEPGEQMDLPLSSGGSR